jgi:hypothetical protein
MRVFFDWPGRAEGGQASPKSVHRLVTASAAALGMLRDGLPRVIRWFEFRPEASARVASPDGLSTGSPTAEGRPRHAMNRRMICPPVMVRHGAVDLATVDILITRPSRTARPSACAGPLNRKGTIGKTAASASKCA